jgi:aminoglycoside phosphotransferase (APT) family kinase protein
MPDVSDVDKDQAAYRVLAAAGGQAGVPISGAELIRDGVNVLYRLPGDIIARIGPDGSRETATRLLHTSRWLARTGIPAVQALDGIGQPTMVDNRPVTWWVSIPEHRYATPSELGTVLKRLHTLTPPLSPPLPVLDPFAGLDEALTAAATLSEHDRTWLKDLLKRLRREYAQLQGGSPRCVVHGDAWQGNVAVPADGVPVLLDLDNLGLGLREWDLIPLAVDHTDFARITSSEYAAFVDAYGGYDVTTWPDYRTLATTTELRWTAFALNKASTDSKTKEQARHRVACLKGEVRQPWSWTAL